MVTHKNNVRRAATVCGCAAVSGVDGQTEATVLAGRKSPAEMSSWREVSRSNAVADLSFFNNELFFRSLSSPYLFLHPASSLLTPQLASSK
jgi:hypothetical protein